MVNLSGDQEVAVYWVYVLNGSNNERANSCMGQCGTKYIQQQWWQEKVLMSNSSNGDYSESVVHKSYCWM